MASRVTFVAFALLQRRASMTITNPYQSPNTESLRETGVARSLNGELTSMKYKQTLIFVYCALTSGLASELSVVLKPLGVIAPGILFGLALCYAVSVISERSTTISQTMIVVASTISYLVAEIVGVSSARLPGFNNGYVYGGIAGALAGFMGSLGVASALAYCENSLRSIGQVALTSLTGMVAGIAFTTVGVYISDSTPLGHPFDDFLTFPLWQVSVATAISFSIHPVDTNDIGA